MLDAKKPLFSCDCGMQKHAINLYHPSDPESPTNELWHFVYLDGAAETYNNVVAEYSLWEQQASDLICCDIDQTTLTAGEYDCLLYGKPALAIISRRFESTLAGRIVLKEDTAERIAFNKNPKNWR